MCQPVRRIRTAVAFFLAFIAGPRTHRWRCTAITRRSRTLPCTLPMRLWPRNRTRRPDNPSAVCTIIIIPGRNKPGPTVGRVCVLGIYARRDLIRSSPQNTFGLRVTYVGRENLRNLFFFRFSHVKRRRFEVPRDLSTNFIGPRILPNVRSFRGEKPKRLSVHLHLHCQTLAPKMTTCVLRY